MGVLNRSPGVAESQPHSTPSSHHPSPPVSNIPEVRCYRDSLRVVNSVGNCNWSYAGYLRKLGHDVEWIGDVAELDLGTDDRSIAVYGRETNRLVLTQDDDFFTQIDIEDTAGILFQKDQTLSAREVGDVVHELSEHIDQSDVTLEYVSRNWL